MQIEFTTELLSKILDNEVLLASLTEDKIDEAKLRMRVGGGFGKVMFDASFFDLSALHELKSIVQEVGNRGLSNRITSLINLKSNPLNAKIGSLKALSGGIAAFVMHDAIKGWLFKREADGTDQPWLLFDVFYNPPTQHSAEMIRIRLMANTAKSTSKGRGESKDVNIVSFTFHREDVHKKTIGELLDSVGLQKETAELHRQYNAELETFIDYSSKVNEQFIATQTSLSIDDSQTSYWSRNKATLKVSAGHKLINDESIIERVVTGEHLSPFWDNQSDEAFKFDQVPYHCKLYFFNLSLHQHHWLHVSFVKPYEYKQDLKDKLVLPQTHHDLVEILASDMGFIMDDIIDGKSGGTTILCKGSPGLGKTLTAEVYSEVIHKPLYRVHSGQLGTSPDNVEKNLNSVLTCAERWGAVMLIDEADVFIRKRGDDIQHNAVVAAFLRTLEYFSGLLFMTTNRQDDVDDAILSRCIAVIKYELPEYEDAKKIWKVLSTQFDSVLSDALVSDLTKTYSSASGRDIKELLKLTLKFCKGKGIEVNAEAFRRCAMFRGLI